MLKQSTMQPNHANIKPVKFSYRYLQALFAMETQYEDRNKFRVRRNGQGRLLAHLTKADIQLATILQVGVNAEGKIKYTNRHQMYQHLSSFYETPINKDQFYAAFDKFVLHGLLSSNNEPDGTISIELNHYLEPDGKLGRFVLLPTLVFSRALTDESIAVQKLYYYGCGQQGNENGKLLQINFDRLSDLLHRQEPGHIRKILERLADSKWNGQPLFAIARVERNMFGRPKAVYQVNAALLPTYTAGESYRTLFPTKKGYRRLLKRLEGYLGAIGCEAFISYADGRSLQELTLMLKDKSEGYIRLVVQRIRDLMDKMASVPDMLSTIRAELQDKASAVLLAVMQETGIMGYLPKRSIPTFTEELKSIPKATMQRACRAAKPDLELYYSRPGAWDVRDYQRPSVKMDRLHEQIDMSVFYAWAYRNKLDPSSFMAAADQAYDYLAAGKTAAEVAQWLAWEMDSLPIWSPIPDPPDGFCLATFLQPYIERLQPSC
ncbi:hypothetical protein DFQ01_11085 [Paenibacillus cellulosilyticus]|uniref:Uncharacterized protein n=1 Tax=Paenibacillus cellulosilyticus TaxID=375489 RepID=A0A2V2Z1F1_9BACL|nr:hypothetical protein [Paenibacillus cellulosilyticus]PWW01195.1 hypothetical protein DFQ01_11085 [Paenibacillus cellulosilyticus]QKS46850.1 hypothetical protein HUB94_20415 [Paenibacillus cellulosilyticus]